MLATLNHHTFTCLNRKVQVDSVHIAARLRLVYNPHMISRSGQRAKFVPHTRSFQTSLLETARGAVPRTAHTAVFCQQLKIIPCICGIRQVITTFTNAHSVDRSAGNCYGRKPCGWQSCISVSGERVPSIVKVKKTDSAQILVSTKLHGVTCQKTANAGRIFTITSSIIHSFGSLTRGPELLLK